jgi:hypothetical protein
MSNKTFGDIPFITFYDTVLSRLAYFTSENFLPAYLDIFGSIIPEKLLKSINDAPMNNIFDSSIYQLSKNTEIPTYTYNNSKFINFTDMAENINKVTKKFVDRKIPKQEKPQKGGIGMPSMPSMPSMPNMNIKSIFGKNYQVAYISISTSNYGGYYILVDTRMPNCIFVVFRGTYSAKSAGAYTKPSSIVPFNIGKNIPPEELKKKLEVDGGKMFGVLTGINKILDDVYHTILQSMLYLAQTYLKPKGKESIKVFTTGHSLGGGLCTLFANDWFETTRISPYDKSPYDIFSKKICCVSIASPRVMSPALSNNFCAKTEKGDILYRRLTNRGDPVPALPQKAILGLSEGFQHPCSAKKYSDSQRKVISMDCGSAQSGINIAYNKGLDCRNTKTGMLSGNISGNALAHTAYLYINFVNAVPVSGFIKSALPVGTPSIKSKPVEIQRTNKGATVARVILGVGEEKNFSTKQQFKSVFFDLNDLRPKDKQILTTNPDAKPVTTEDTLMNGKVFDDIIKKMTQIKLGETLNQVIPGKISKLEIGSIEPMPNISGLLKSTPAKSIPVKATIKKGNPRENLKEDIN